MTSAPKTKKNTVSSSGLSKTGSPLAASTVKRARGRPVEVVNSVFEATQALLMEVPVTSLSFETVAERASVHKTTLYRRWGNIDALIADVLNHISTERIPMPDAGSLKKDVRALITLYAQHFRSDFGMTINRILIENKRSKSNNLTEWMKSHFKCQQKAFHKIGQRAVARQEIRSVDDFMFAMELALGAMLMKSLMTGNVIDRQTENKLYQVVLQTLDLQ